MKAVILALIVGLVLFVVISFRLRFAAPKEPARTLLRLYLGSGPIKYLADQMIG